MYFSSPGPAGPRRTDCCVSFNARTKRIRGSSTQRERVLSKTLEKLQQINNLIFQSKVSQGLVIIICLENGGRMVLDLSQ